MRQKVRLLYSGDLESEASTLLKCWCGLSAIFRARVIQSLPLQLSVNISVNNYNGHTFS